MSRSVSNERLTRSSFDLAHHPLLITHHSLLITHYSLLITHYSSLITHYSLIEPRLCCTPIAPHGHQRNIEHLGSLFQTQTGEVAKLNDLTLARIERGQ